MQSDAPICWGCIGDKVLQHRAKAEGTRRKCAHCQRRRVAIPLCELAAAVDEVYRTHYEPGQSWGGEVQGSYPEDIVSDLLQCDLEVAEAVVSFLSEEESHLVAHDGNQAYYDSTYRYEEIGASAFYENDVWREFEDKIKYRRRFFGHDGTSHLNELLGNVNHLAEMAGVSLVMDLHPGDSLFRARVAGSAENLKKVYRDLPGSLGSPPIEKILGNRMNPAGIPALYASFSREIAVREVRPPVGAIVVTAAFRPRRQLRLINLPALSEGNLSLSPFEDEYWTLTSQWRFVTSFHQLISRPVLPSREALDYLPTQAVAEYLITTMEVDGIVFGSAQTGQYSPEQPTVRNRNNMALFCAPFLSSSELEHLRQPDIDVNFLTGSLPDRVHAEPSLELVPESVEAVIVRAIDLHIDPYFGSADFPEGEDDF